MKTLPAHETCHHTTYRLECERYEQLLARAKNRCELCGIDAAATPQGKLSIDHDRQLGYGAVRGLVCQQCNAHLGMVERGERATDERTATYMSHAWYLTYGITPSRRTLTRVVRLPDALWKPAKAKAAAEGTDMTAVINDALKRYVKTKPKVRQADE